MAKANLQAQARDLGLSDDGTVAELEEVISEAGYEPDYNYESEEIETVSDEPDTSVEPDETSEEQSPEDAAAAAVVIPEYEQRVAAAAAAGDQTEIDRVQEEYWQARQERAQASQEAESEG